MTNDWRTYVNHDGCIAHLHDMHLQKPAIHPPLEEWERIRFQTLKLWIRRCGAFFGQQEKQNG